MNPFVLFHVTSEEERGRGKGGIRGRGRGTQGVQKAYATKVKFNTKEPKFDQVRFGVFVRLGATQLAATRLIVTTTETSWRILYFIERERTYIYI